MSIPLERLKTVTKDRHKVGAGKPSRLQPNRLGDVAAGRLGGGAAGARGGEEFAEGRWGY